MICLFIKRERVQTKLLFLADIMLLGSHSIRKKIIIKYFDIASPRFMEDERAIKYSFFD